MTARRFLKLAIGMMMALSVCGAGNSGHLVMPDPELIEFLGNTVTTDGTAIDPLVFADEEAVAKPAENPRHPRKQRTRKPDAATSAPDVERIER